MPETAGVNPSFLPRQYAIVLEDAPVAKRISSRQELRSGAALEAAQKACGTGLRAMQGVRRVVARSYVALAVPG